MSFTIVQVRGTFDLPDRDDPTVRKPAQGQVEFTLEESIQDPVSNEIIAPTTTTVSLDETGRFYAFLPATDDPSVQPSPVAYRVVIKILDAPEVTRRIEIPAASELTGVDLADLSDAMTTPVFTYTLLSVFETHTSGTAADNVHPGYLTDLPAGNNVWNSSQTFKGRALNGVDIDAYTADATLYPDGYIAGTTSIVPAYEAAIAKVQEMDGGVVRFGPATYLATIPDVGQSYYLYLPSNTTLEGAGAGVTTLLANPTTQAFARLITSTNESNVGIRRMKIDGNRRAMTSDVSHPGQRHTVYFDGCDDPLVEDCDITQADGDLVYWSGTGNESTADFRPCVRPQIWRTRLHDGYRCGVHARVVKDGHISQVDIYDQPFDNMIKAEQTGAQAAWLVDGLTITGVTFEGAGGNNGVVISGMDATHRCRRITVTGCVFNNCLLAIGTGQYADGWAISTCTLRGCGRAIAPTFGFVITKGYTAVVGVSVSTITIIGGGGADAGTAHISSWNSTNFVVSNVNMGSLDVGVKAMVRLLMTQNSQVMGGVYDGTGTTGAIAVTVNRSPGFTIGGGVTLTAPNGGKGVVINDTATEQATNTTVGHVVVNGPANTALDVAGLTTAGALTLAGPIVAPGATTMVTGLTSAKQNQSWVQRAPVLPTASLETGNVNRDGRLVIEDLGGTSGPNLVVYANGRRTRLTGVTF